MRRAVFLDRDGVLNALVARDGRGYSPRRASEFTLVDGIEDAVTRLKARGLLVLVATNQPDIARGRLAPEELAQMHALLAARAPVDEILVCPHDNADACHCRKPKPGLLTNAAERYTIELSRSYMVGDSQCDLDAAAAAGCAGLLIETPWNADIRCTRRFPDLARAVDFILDETR